MQYKLLIVALLGCLALTSAINMRHMSSASEESSSTKSTKSSSGSSGSNSQQQKTAGGDGPKLPLDKAKEAAGKALAEALKANKKDVATTIDGTGKVDFKPVAAIPAKHNVAGLGKKAELIKYAEANKGYHVFHAKGACGSGASGQKTHSGPASGSSSGSGSGPAKQTPKADFAGAFNEMTEGAEAADADDADGAIINEAAAPSAEDAEDGLSQDEVEDQDEALEFLELFGSGSGSPSSGSHPSSSSGASAAKSGSGKSGSGNPSNFHNCCLNGDKLDCK